MVQKWLRNPK